MEIDLELLSIQNPWWINLGQENGLARSLEFDPILSSYARKKLKYRPEVLNYDWRRGRVYAFYGARGVGKTTILKLLIKDLIEKNKINPDNIFYYSCHNLDTFERLNELIKIFLAWRAPTRPKHLFILIDEITLLKDWRRGLSFLFRAGKFKKATVILTGSVLPRPGRNRYLNIRERIISSFNFSSFLELVNLNLASRLKPENYKNYQNQLEYYLDIYFLTGGFISPLNSFREDGAVNQSIYSNYLYWLIADLAKMGRDIILWRQILEQVILNLRQPVGYQTIARRTKAKTHLTVAEYLKILEDTLAIKMVCQSDRFGQPTTRRAKKVYFRDPFLFWVFYSYINGALDYWHFSRQRLHRADIFACLVENVVFSHLIKAESLEDWGGKVTYWRQSATHTEINFLDHQRRKTVPILIDYQSGLKLKPAQSVSRVFSQSKKIFSQAGFKRGIIINQKYLCLRGPVKILPLTYFLLFYSDF